MSDDFDEPDFSSDEGEAIDDANSTLEDAARNFSIGNMNPSWSSPMTRNSNSNSTPQNSGFTNENAQTPRPVKIDVDRPKTEPGFTFFLHCYLHFFKSIFKIKKPNMNIRNDLHANQNPTSVISPATDATYNAVIGMYVKTGVDLSNMSSNITKIYSTVRDVIKKITNQDGTITSGRDGSNHKANSKHHSGEAIDIRSQAFSDKQVQKIIEELRKKLGTDYQVIDETHEQGVVPHIHVQYHPLRSSV